VFNFKYEEIWSNHKKHTISATDQLKLRSKIRQKQHQQNNNVNQLLFMYLAMIAKYI